MDSRPILVALDGEPHTAAAVQWALRLAARLGLGLTGVHVRDPYLKQFHNDLYAQGRLEFLQHVDDCLATLAVQVEAGFRAAAAERGAQVDFRTLDGDPYEQLSREAQAGGYALLVMGRKRLATFAAWRSGKLSARLSAAVTAIPVLLVPGDSGEETEVEE